MVRICVASTHCSKVTMLNVSVAFKLRLRAILLHWLSMRPAATKVLILSVMNNRSLVLLALRLLLLTWHWHLIIILWSILIVFERHRIITCRLLLLHHLSGASLTRPSARWTPTSSHHRCTSSIQIFVIGCSPGHPTSISSIGLLLWVALLSLVLHCRVLERSLRCHRYRWWIGISTGHERLGTRLNFKKGIRALLAVLVLSHKVVY